MTVQALAEPVLADDRGAAEREFSEVFRDLFPKIRSYLCYRLETYQRPLAEDMASEAFECLWTTYYARGKRPDNPRPLLYTIARRVLSKHYAGRSNREVVLDLADPVNTPVIATGSVYAVTMPEAAGLIAELEVAMEQMAVASKNWRASHQDAHSLRRRVEDDYVVTETKEANRQRLAVADAEQQDRLRAFQNACARVGNLRAGIEAIAGPAWKSATGLPAPALRGKGQDGEDYRTNPTVTHCPHGHALDADTVAFRENGDRECRRCARRKARRNCAPGSVKRGVPETKIRDLRAALSDPANADLSVARICEGFGISAGVAYNRIPDVQDLRRAAAEAGSDLRKRLDQALSMLTDPDCDLSTNRIAELCGMRAQTVQGHFPTEFEAYRRRLQERRDGQLRVAAALLRDPHCALSLQAIADAAQINRKAIQRHLADDVAAYQARRAELAAAR